MKRASSNSGTATARWAGMLPSPPNRSYVGIGIGTGTGTGIGIGIGIGIDIDIDCR